MRKFLLILVCVFSFFACADTNVVQLTQEQYLSIMNCLNSILGFYDGQIYETISSDVDGTGELFYNDEYPLYYELPAYQTLNIVTIAKLLHLIFTGSTYAKYDSSTNNILAYASSLREHNAEVREYLANIEQSTQGTWNTAVGLVPYFGGIWQTTKLFHSDYTNNFNRLYLNIDRLYDAITNIDFKVSISNQIDLLQVMSGGISNNFDSVSNLLDKIYKQLVDFRLVHEQNLNFHFQNLDDTLNNNHSELMDYLHSLSNSVLFASNLCNCCEGLNTNYQDSVLAMLGWMTNNWRSSGSDDTIHGSDGSNSVWWAWRPDEQGWPDLLIPALEWRQDSGTLGWSPSYKPKDEQYDRYFLGIAQQYNALLDGFETGDIKGQEFLTGLVDLQLHIMANMSTQLYMIDSKLPSKTNLWDWIEEYKSKVSEEVTKAEQENSQIISSVSSLIDYTPFSIVGGHFPRVSSCLNSLKVDEGASTVVRIPIPRALRHSDSDELVVDVAQSNWYSTGRNWCRWLFSFIWGWLFIRLGLVPIFYVFFFTIRVAEISAHLVFMGSVRGSSGIVSSFGAAAVDMILSLIGIDTDFKKFVWGIMRN